MSISKQSLSPVQGTRLAIPQVRQLLLLCVAACSPSTPGMCTNDAQCAPSRCCSGKCVDVMTSVNDLWELTADAGNRWTHPGSTGCTAVEAE